MKKFILDLSEYEVEERKDDVVKMVPYPLKDNLSCWLRIPGIFQSAESLVEAAFLARQLKNCQEDNIILDEREAGILKQCLDTHIKRTYEGKPAFPIGGEIHEEAVCRVVKMKEVD